MFNELFKLPAIVARYREAPYAESRERFLKKAREDGYPPSMIERIAWALLVVAQAVNLDTGPVTARRLEKALRRRTRFRSAANSTDSEHTIQLFLHFGEAWLRSIGGFVSDPEPQLTFAAELHAFMEHMRVERGLSPVTIRARDERLRWFFASLPPNIRTLREITVSHIDLFLQGQARRVDTPVLTRAGKQPAQLLSVCRTARLVLDRSRTRH
jgi:integrase/recombinase XerD